MAEWPRVCVLGSFPSLCARGLPTQGQELARQLARSGAQVSLVSARRTRLGRLAHVLTEVIFHGWRYDTLCLQVFGSKAAILEVLTITLNAFWRRRLVLVMRGGALPDFLRRTRFPLARIYRLADCIVCPSGYLAGALRPFSLQARVIPNMIDLENYHFRHRRRVEPRVLWMRSFHPLYNPLMGLRAYALVKARYPLASLTMAGMDRNYEAEVRRAATEMGLDDVRFPGFVSKVEIPALMKTHDIYINTPHIDNMPISVIEALASGMIVISTNVGGIPYLVREGETGLLVGDDDAEGAAEAISRVVDHPQLASRLSQCARQAAEEFTWVRVEHLWLEALSGNPSQLAMT